MFWIANQPLFSLDIFDQILMRFLFTQNIISFLPCGVDVSQCTKRCLGYNLHIRAECLVLFVSTAPSSLYPQLFLCSSLYNKICWTMSWMRSEPSCHSNKPFYLRPATYITMQNKKGRENEAKVLSLRVGELGCFYFVIFESQRELLFSECSTHLV